MSVRVPHNVPRRVSARRTPDPWLVAGCWLLAVAGFIKPVVFEYLSASVLVKPLFFSTISVAGFIKPMVFRPLRL